MTNSIQPSNQPIQNSTHLPSRIAEAPQWQPKKIPVPGNPDTTTLGAMNALIEEAVERISARFPGWDATPENGGGEQKESGDVGSRFERAADPAQRKHRHHHKFGKLKVTAKPHDPKSNDEIKIHQHPTDPGAREFFGKGPNGDYVQLGWVRSDGKREWLDGRVEPEKDSPGHSHGGAQAASESPVSQKGVGEKIFDYVRSFLPRLSEPGPVTRVEQALDHPEPPKHIGPKHNILLITPDVAKSVGGDIKDPRIQSRIIDVIQKKGIEPFAKDFATFAHNVPLRWDFRFDYDLFTPTGTKENVHRDMLALRHAVAEYIVNNNNNQSNDHLNVDSATTFIVVGNVDHGAVGMASPGRAFMFVSYSQMDQGVLAHEMGHRFGLDHDDKRGGVMYPEAQSFGSPKFTEQNKQDMHSPLAQALGYDPKTGELLSGSANPRG